ncbi:LAGLIDADG family homing endonuclease [Candidatus Woesearchaeota archaeon]|nr:LAGLIDADG family homing endonuclease [Candidatus Woesearchaeota archaeon]
MALKISIYDLLKDSNIAYVRVSNFFKNLIRKKILAKYSSLIEFTRQHLQVSDHTLVNELRINKYVKLKRLMIISDILGVPSHEVYNEISAFFARGSSTSNELMLPRELYIDEQFVECYALYLAEGDNGSNGRTMPRKVRLTNSDIFVHNLFIIWLRKYFPNNPFYFKVLVPHTHLFTKEHCCFLRRNLRLGIDQLKVKKVVWKRKTGFVYRTCLDSALLIDILLAIEDNIKSFCSKDKRLSAAYVRGMMIGEGTVYNNRARYVRIEMKNEKEIKYLHRLLVSMGYRCKTSVRTNRPGMWSIYIGAKQLKKFAEEIGFGVHRTRQNLLVMAAGKKLRVNQYC